MHRHVILAAVAQLLLAAVFFATGFLSTGASVTPESAQAATAPASNVVAARPFARAASVVSVSRVQNISEDEAKGTCEYREAVSRFTWHCETWYGGDCVRISLTHPNFVACNPDFVLDAWDRKHSQACTRIALYYSGARNQFKPRITWRKGGIPRRYRTTSYHCTTHAAGFPSRV